MPDSLLDRLLDRLIRRPPTRAWIALVAFALIGIVAMQLWVVKLGVGIGRALEHAELLQRENSTLAIEDSALASGERVERLAVAKGMVPAPPGALRFDPLRGALDTRLAVAALAKPSQARMAPSATTSAETGASATAGGEAASAGATAAEGASAETSTASTEGAASAGGGTQAAGG
jgi:hypothetical protein